MAAITNYATLSAALADWAERSDINADEMIGLAAAEFRLHFTPNFAKEATTTLTFASGSVALPAGFIRAINLSHATYGELTEASIGAVRERRRLNETGIPSIFAVTGSTIEVGPSYDGALTLDLEGTLVGLSGSNATNWLITNAPMAYLAMCIHFIKARMEDPAAPSYRASALDTLDALGMQSLVATHGRASVRIPGMTP